MYIYIYIYIYIYWMMSPNSSLSFTQIFALYLSFFFYVVPYILLTEQFFSQFGSSSKDTI